ncbi:hypothetical protein J6590_013456, partial [Homalodisca vitripennis]
KMSETQEVVAVEPVEPARSLLRNTSKSTTHIPGVSLKTCIVLNNNCSLLRNFQTRPTSTHTFVRFSHIPQPAVNSTIQ